MERYVRKFSESLWKDYHLKFFKPVAPYTTNFAEIFISTTDNIKGINKTSLIEHGKDGKLYYYIFAVTDKRYANKIFEEPFKYINSIENYWALRYDLDANEIFSPIDFFIHPKKPNEVSDLMHKLIKKVSH